ncbi:MAG TPA: HD domain-containing phosphohydrolase [Gammaproteobacteria bacterium]|nr:HD domain-containing phosphohydrolase [Gammaproteobacteria bacterium]
MSAAQATQISSSAEAKEPATLLFVDDEANILSSLQRLFRPVGYRILTALSGAEGLAIMEKEAVDLIISDMRMPNMDGADFLEQVEKRWPDTLRILLTGYADITSTVNAINKGKIYRYISKPWEDNDIRLLVQHALQGQHLEREKKRLEQIVLTQNEELKELNTNLEKRVEARTQEIKQTSDMLDLAFNELKRGYAATISVFANLVELRDGATAGHARRVAEHARTIAQQLQLVDDETQDVYFAALLHDVGKIGLPDNLIHKPYIALSHQDRERVEQHCAVGQTALTGLDTLQKAAVFIRGHHERYDGKGFPDGLMGPHIPLGARILAVANDYDALQIGSLLDVKLSPVEARAFLVSNRGMRYDPAVVDIFLKIIEGSSYGMLPQKEVPLASEDVREGQVLSRDMIDPEGRLLLTKARVLNADLIKKIKSFEREVDRGFTIYVQNHP